MRHTFWIFLCLITQLTFSELDAQDLQLPDDYSIDIQLGIAAKSRMLGASPEILGTEANVIGENVFHNLIGLSYTQPYPWKLTLVNNVSVNASSTAGGQVYVYGGILPIIGESKGLWAAVLSHEVAHTGERHVVKLYVREMYNQRMVAYYRARILAGDNSANYALAAFQISSALFLKKWNAIRSMKPIRKGC